jgi:hypothetical protein
VELHQPNRRRQDATDVSTITAPLPTTPRWLIAIAYWLAGGFIKSGLGNRIAYSMVAAFGKTTLGLTYSLVFGEALLSPAIPSVAARAGGIFFPLAKVRCECNGGAGVNGCSQGSQGMEWLACGPMNA